MSLTQQFIVISIFPLSFLLMIGYVWRSDVKQKPLLKRWSWTLLMAAIWASGLLRFYGGMTFPSSLVFGWGVAAKYALDLAALGILLTTVAYLSISRERSILVTVVSGLFIAFGLVLDPAVWGNYLPDFVLADQTVRHFDLWAAVWVASWLLPVLASWLITRQLSTTLPLSLYRNKISYWLLMLFLFGVGGALASIHQPRQPIWQETALLLILPALLVGTVSIARSQLPDLQLALRQVLRRLSGTFIIFGLTWAALWFITRRLEAIPLGVSPNLLLVLTAALFAGLFTVTFRFINDLTRRLFLPSAARQAVAMSDYVTMTGYLPEPEQLGDSFLGVVSANITVNDVWLLTTESGPGGQLVLRPLSHTGATPPPAIQFASDNPFATYLYNNDAPLAQDDINNLRAFTPMTTAEKEMIAGWQRVLYAPLRAGNALVGVLALGAKLWGEMYTMPDLQTLQLLVTQFSPLLAQSRNLANLHRVNEYVFQQNQLLAQTRQHLQSLAELNEQFAQYISPDLKRPLRAISESLTQLRSKTEETAILSQIETIQQQLAQAQIPLDKLINVAAHLQNRTHFQFELVQLDEIARTVQRRLNAMAGARHVHLDFEAGGPVSPILADAAQLTEAVQHVLHNAIKFNKIGGIVTMSCGTAGSEVYLRVVDTGVGIPPERLDMIQDGYVAFNANANEQGRKANLGLTLAYFIITAHGGRLEMQSKYGSGSRFTIYLPLVLQE